MRFAATILGCALLAGCAVGPRYQRPAAQAPPAWKTQAPWQAATPKDSFPKGPWWDIFADAELNGYEEQLLKANYSLQAARDRLEQARAFARVTSAGFFPQVSAGPNIQRGRVSANRASLGGTPATTAVTETITTLPFSLSYEADLFGRVRRSLEAANASLQGSAADLQNVQLVLTAELAADYFDLRELDAESAVVQESVANQEKALELVQRRHQGGVASGLEVAQQETLLDSTRTQLSLLQQQRAQFAHAIAALTGTPAPAFSVPVAPLHALPPAVPLGVPSDVLERRPDIATAERRMAFENAQVGVATAAFYPHVTISGSGGLQSRDITTLVSTPSLFWSVGTDLFQPIFNGGRNRANLQLARASYDESVANYRDLVLTAFQQVEDALTSLDTLSKAAATQQAAVEDARRALTIANNRYLGGLTTYLDVITAQTTLLQNERLATQLLGQRMVTSVLLVKALGGGWDASQIQNERVHPRAVQTVQP